MQKLNFQDASFLRGETPERPQHVGALMIFSQPKGADKDYMRQLAEVLPDKMIAANPGFMRKLKDPADVRNPCWVQVEEINRSYHFRHYGLPQPGSMEELLQMVSLAHQPVLDRSRPLWEFHLIEGLPQKQFAVYGRVHHSMIDGMSGMGIMDKLLGIKPQSVAALRAETESPGPGKKSSGSKAKESWMDQLDHNMELLREQSRAIPEVITQFRRMGRNRDEDAELSPLPFTAPASILNQQGGPDRQLIALNLPLQSLADIGHSAGGTVNDALLAIFGGALRNYLINQGALPGSSLVAVLPVGVKGKEEGQGNSLSMITAPLGSNISDPVKRLQRIVKVTSNAKSELGQMSKTGLQDMLNLVMMPVMLMNLTHTAGKMRPAMNVVVSNVPGPKKKLYLADAPLQSMYPLSLLMDAMGMNFTAISYRKEVCIGLIACPDGLDNIVSMEKLLREAHEEYKAVL